MSELKINLSDYKASGVYFVEVDNSVITRRSYNSAARLATGFSTTGPFNRPVYLSGPADVTQLFGSIDRKLERKGCYTNRNIRTMVAKAPIFVINLMPIDTRESESNSDTVGYATLSMCANRKNFAGKTLYAYMYDRSRFWIADENAFVKNVFLMSANEEQPKIYKFTSYGDSSASVEYANGEVEVLNETKEIDGKSYTKVTVIENDIPEFVGKNFYIDSSAKPTEIYQLYNENEEPEEIWVKFNDPTEKIRDYDEAAPFGVGNCGTKDISLIIRKAEGLNGYNITFLEWFGSAEAIPYKWVNPNDYVSDYFVQVIAVAGKWDESLYKAYSTDIMWSNYFTENGLIKGKLGKFLRLDSVNVIGNWTGCILPNFLDKQGNDRSIDYLINKSCNTTGLLWGVNNNALDTLCLSNREIDGDGKVVTVDDYKFFLDNDGDGAYDESFDSKSYYNIDLCGHTLTAANQSIENFMSYCFNTENISNYVATMNASTGTVSVGDASNGTQIALRDTEFAIVESIDHSTGKSNLDGQLEINIGDLVRTVDNLMTRIVKKRKVKADDYTIVTIYTALNAIKDMAEEKTPGQKTIEVHKNFTEMYETLKFIPLEGLNVRNKHMPGYDKDGKVDVEAGVEKIYSMLYDEGIHKGLLNEDSIDFRYIVDTMAYGMGPECGGKKYLAKLAMEKGHCTALCNVPSMSQFANSDGTYAPYFCATFEPGEEAKPSFNVKYIAEGGNQDMAYSNPDIASFSLPTEENGAKNCGFFAPFFKYAEGSKTILVPPAADISNTFMNRFLGTGNPYATVANANGIINNGQITDVEYLFDKEDRGYLETFGINPVIMRQGNIMIYGDRTAYQTVDSDLNFLHVRELVNTIEISCKNILDRYVFTYNTPLVRAEIVSRLNPILSAMKDSRALIKYEIQCDENNNTKEIIDDKFCIVDIGIWVSQNMEKIVTRITLNRSTTAEV